MMNSKYKDLNDIFVMVTLLVGLITVPLAAWCTHVITCIQREEWLFLIAGAIAFPVAIVHGFGIWIGVW